MNLEATKKELDSAYQKLAEMEEKVVRLNKELNKQFKVEEILIAAGFITKEKVREAECILDAL